MPDTTDPEDRSTPRPVVVETAGGGRALVDANRIPTVTAAMRQCRPWQFGDERHGRAGVPCPTPGCSRHLAVSPDPPAREARPDPGTLHVCGHAAAGYCAAMFEREAPGAGAPS